LNAEKLILGTVQFGLAYGINNASGKPGIEKVFEILSYAAESGVQILDTADAYGDATALIGRFHQNSNYRFVINTKFHINDNDAIASQLQRSIEQLYVDSINTYFYHRFSDLADYPDSKRALKELKDKGFIKKVGVSVYENEEFKTAIADDDIDVIQLPFNLLDNYKQRGSLLRQARQRKKEIQVRSVFLQGLFFKDPSSYPPALQPLGVYLQQVSSYVKESGRTMEDVALGYVLSKNEIDYILIGVDSKEQLAKNLRYMDVRLPDELVEQIDRVDVKEVELLYPKNWK
jgi:aryl-alcohol dehydrogenase-like predicted oxidoreductase